MSEKIVIFYDHTIVYSNEDLNAVGATTSTILRNVTAHNNGITKYVKKFGDAYTLKDITAGVITTPRSDGGGVNKWWYEFYDFDTHTLLATVKDENGVSTFIDGAALASAASGIYVKVIWKSGTVTITDGDAVRVNTDIDAGGRNIKLSAESFTSGEMLFYFAHGSSSYYMDNINDQSAKYGGYRNSGNGTFRRSYYNIQDAIDDVVAAGAPFTNVTVLDSESYDEELDADFPGLIVQAALGQTPKITRGVGARITREVEHDGNNADTRYVSKEGDDTNSGTFQEPYLTLQFAENNMGGLAYLKIRDSRIYEENIGININLSLEPVYGEVPIIQGSSSSQTIEILATTVNISGIKISSSYIAAAEININIDNYAGTIRDCNIFGSKRGINFLDKAGYNGDIISNHIYDCSEWAIILFHGTLSITGGDILKNIIHDCANGIYMSISDTIPGINIKNNLIYKITWDGLRIYADTNNAVIENNTTVYCSRYGLEVFASAAWGGTLRDNISYFNTTFDLRRDGASVAITITESNYGTNSGLTIGAGCKITDPKFCKITDPYKFGISADSGAYRTDTSLDDMGAHFRIIEINASNVTLNGFIIDGQDQYNNAIYILDAIDHLGTKIYWNSIKDFQGIEIDLYDNDTDTGAEIKNNKIYNGGNGIKLSYGGNTVEENLIYNNSIFGIWSDYTGQVFDHNIFYNNKYGTYFESNTAGIIFKNSISHLNSLYGIYSEVPVKIYYCSVSDKTYNVTRLASDGNLTVNPIFVSEDLGEEDFHIKTVETGSTQNSLCKNAAEDGYDIGAYLVDRSIVENFWKRYPLYYNPTNIDFTNQGKGVIKFENGLGSLTLWAKNFKRMFTFNYAKNAGSVARLRKKLEYFTTRINTRGRCLAVERTKFRISFLPVQKILTGTGVISASDKILTDSLKNLIEDENRGFVLAVQFETGGSTIIDPVLHTARVIGAGWTNDQHKNYILKHAGNFYYILSNTAEILFVSDPLNTLVAGTYASYSIEKYFKVLENNETEFTLEDNNLELVDGTYSYYIDFITTKIQKPSFGFTQMLYDFLTEISKTGYSATFEED